MNCLEQVALDRADLFMHATASSLANLHQAGIREEIMMLPRVYTSVPLTLLLSKQYGPKAELLERFNDMVSQMEADGSLQRLIQTLLEREWPTAE